jgi:cyclophilin family peptidyl-prolyl cis-trans isomerase
MNLSGLGPSPFDEISNQADSSSPSDRFRLETGFASWGSLAGTDTLDVYQIKPVKGAYRLIVSSDPVNATARLSGGWGSKASDFSTFIINSQGSILVAEDASGPDSQSDQLTFSVTGPGTLYVAIQRNSISSVNYAATLLDLSPPVAPQLIPGSGIDTLTNPQVTVQTNLGSIVVELEADAAPQTVINFLTYVEDGYYSNTLFHRVIRGFMTQGGGFTSGMAQKSPTYDAIPLEASNGLSNLRGTVAMARTNDPNSATSQFYVNLVDNSFLDASATSVGYTVFGRVVTGMSTADEMATQPTSTVGAYADVPFTDIITQSATLTLAGQAVSQNATFTLTNIEPGATWDFSLDGGTSWHPGVGRTLAIPEGDFAAGAIQVRQTDATGLQSASVNAFTSGLKVQDSPHAPVMAYLWKSHALVEGVTLRRADVDTAFTVTTGADGQALVQVSAAEQTPIAVERPLVGTDDAQTKAAVNLQDAIAILKMIVGLDVNGAGKPLSPYQALAADFDGNGTVSLTDAIGVLKHVVGLTAPSPTLRFVNELDAAVADIHLEPLQPGTPPAITASMTLSGVKDLNLVSYLTGDVDGSYAPPSAPVVPTDHFLQLESSGLPLSQFGIYSP